ncbi:MAG: hypothetical protein MUO23_04875 [Anaerolineales bacterium]|nr:hypothetical protein [Anaerolineales bacterium]
MWRAWAAAVGLVSFAWLATEARQLTAVLVLAAALTVTAAGPRAGRWVTKKRSGLPRLAAAGLAGCGIGACVPWVAAGLMLVKVSLHSHAQTEFSTDELIAVLGRIPVWAVGGGLLGGAAVLAPGLWARRAPG